MHYSDCRIRKAFSHNGKKQMRSTYSKTYCFETEILYLWRRNVTNMLRALNKPQYYHKLKFVVF